MKKEYTKPIVEVTTCCASENILSASRPEKPVKIEVDEKEEENPWGGIKGGRLGSGLIRKTQINIVLQNIYIKLTQ